MKKILLCLFLLLVFSGCGDKKVADVPKENIKESLEVKEQVMPASPQNSDFTLDQNLTGGECTLDSDCIDEVEWNPACSHYCVDEECNDALICNAHTKLKKGEELNVNCFWNAPCIKPSKVICENSRCVSK